MAESGYRTHIIRQGEYLDKVAFRYGKDPKDVWAFPKNQELAKKRGDPGVLRAGDVLYIPQAPVQPLPFVAGTDNAYEALPPKLDVKLTIRGTSGPLSNEPWETEIDGSLVSGTTDAEGALVLKVPVLTREVSLRLVDRGTTVRLFVGDMDPVDTPTGQRARLAGLGYYTAPRDSWPSDKWFDPALEEALMAFQTAEKLPSTGKADDTTQRALTAAYGA